MSNRKCGECTACCKLLPVEELGKPSTTKCVHQCSKGCRIYTKASFPVSCAVWTCRWLVGDNVGQRPDRSGYVVDIMADWVKVGGTDADTGEEFKEKFLAAQVWVDPDHKDSHRDPALRAYLDQRRLVAIIRYSSGEGFVLFPPSLTGKDWIEHGSVAHKREDITQELGMPLELI